VSIEDHLQEMHGQDVAAEWRYAPDSWRRNAMSYGSLSERHTELHEEDLWNDASERHTHPWWHDLATLIEASVFEADYAKALETSVHDLHGWGRFAEPCKSCDFTGCNGWKMGHQWEEAIKMTLSGR
jgi:hypothetical protein